MVNLGSIGRICEASVAFKTALLIAALAFGLAACGETESSTATPPPPPTVTVSKPLVRDLVEWDEYTGQFAATEFVELRARVSGYLRSVHFQDGEIVGKGDLLFIIDPRPFEVALATAKAQLAQASARLELARRQLGRAEQLRQRDFVPASTYDERAQQSVVAAAEVEGARAAIRGAELDLEFTRITAPVTGRVGRREVDVGNLVSGGPGGSTTLLTTIVTLDPIHFNFDISESNYLSYQRALSDGRLKSTRDGSVPVYVRLFDEENWPREGRMDYVANRVDRSSGTIRARGIFPNPDSIITPGQFGRIRIPGSERYQALLLPDSALMNDQSRKIVMVVKDDGTVEPRQVRPGPKELGLRIIRSGLQPTDTVIINGLVRARAGAKVTPEQGKIEPVEERPSS